MKSPQIARLADAANYSDLLTRRSQAGWYVGSSYGKGEPGTRDSFGYYRTEREARRALILIRLGKLDTRLHP